jgi:SOS response regulatory protein OraA/RecX
MTKFKVAFTMEAKTLFLFMSKILPIEDLKVEEKLDEAELQAALRSIAPKAEQTELAQPLKRKYAKTRVSIPFDPDKGINKILLASLAKRPHRAIELRTYLTEGGYSGNSVGSRLQQLRKHGAVVQHGDGLWSLSNG